MKLALGPVMVIDPADLPTAPPARLRMVGFLECEISEKDGSIVFPALHCPHGHRIPYEHLFHEAGYPRCHHQDSKGREDCGARLFLQFFPRIANHHVPPMLFVAEVTWDEIKHIRRAGLDVPGILDYLGVRWHPPRILVERRRE